MNQYWPMRWYQYCLDRPARFLLVFLIGLGFSLPGIQSFSFDASVDTLVVQGDPELVFYREVLAQFGGDEFMIMTLSPFEGDVFEPQALALIAKLEAELEVLPGVRGVLTVLDVPLLKNPLGPVANILNNMKTLRDEETDPALAKDELITSPLFKDLLVSSDGRATALRIDLEIESVLDELRERRDELRMDESADRTELARATKAHKAARSDLIVRRSQLMDDVRDVKERYQNQALLRIGGVPMMASDMIDFVKSDNLHFGSAILVIMILVLFYFFRHPTWVFLSLSSAVLTNLLLVGILGYINQAATVISSNFIALLSITTIALTIHLIVRYQEIQLEEPGYSHPQIVAATLFSKFVPCVFTTLTTIVAFGSLALSKILPVADFGWIMMIGIACSMIVSFTFFPAMLLLLGLKSNSVRPTTSHPVLLRLAQTAIGRWRSIVVASVALLLLVTYGLSLLSLDNRFIEYFRSGTDIREGLEFIDQNLGGTTPFDVIVSFPPWEAGGDSEGDDFADEGDDFASENENYPEKYWFTPDKIRRLGALHTYIENQPVTGKTLSVATLEFMARDFNDGKPLSAVVLTTILEQIPTDLRMEFINPYAHPEGGLMRINSRIIETGAYFSREELIRDISNYAENELGFAQGEVRTTGIMVMLNDMITQLLQSQTDTILFVLFAVMMMFIICLRSMRLSILGVLPNVLAAALVMALLGYAGLPLNMMTITISAISLGIGVDDAIHYLHRYQQERRAGYSTSEAIKRSHQGVGSAMYYTSITVVAGFSTLVLSNFIPNATFGILVALAMVVALLANLVILPALLTAFSGSDDNPKQPSTS